MPTQESFHERCRTGTGTPPGSSGSASGVPQAEGETGAVYLCCWRQAGQRTLMLSAMVR
jgi:hypothetical protein